MKYPYSVKRITTTDRADWLKTRRRGIGGSDAGAILGLNPYKSPIEVYYEKRGEIEARDLSRNEAVQWGIQLEDIVARRYQMEHKTVKVMRERGTLQSKTYPFMLANLDRIVRDSGAYYGLEVKTAGAHNYKYWRDGNIPPWYMAQVQHYMAVTGLPFFDFAVLIGGQDYEERRVERDDKFIDEILTPTELEFWKMVDAGTPPAYDGSESAWRVINALYPVSNPGEVDLSDNDKIACSAASYAGLMAKMEDIRAQLKGMEKEAAKYKQEICAAMGENGTAQVGDCWIAEYKTVQVKGYTVAPRSYRKWRFYEVEGID